MIIEGNVKGIPCKFNVTTYNCVNPDFGADNPADYYGYTEIEFDVLDLRGRPAPWLKRKLDDNENERITMFLEEYIKQDADEDDGQ